MLPKFHQIFFHVTDDSLLKYLKLKVSLRIYNEEIFTLTKYLDESWLLYPKKMVSGVGALTLKILRFRNRLRFYT